MHDARLANLHVVPCRGARLLGRNLFLSGAALAVEFDQRLSMQKHTCHVSSCSPVLCRWEGCFIRFLDGMLQVNGWMTSGAGSLKIPTGIRSLVIAHPEGCAHGWQPYTAQRLLGELTTPLATITGLSLSPAPRSAGLLNTTCAAPACAPLPDCTRDGRHGL